MGTTPITLEHKFIMAEYCTLTGVEYQAVCDLAAGGEVEQLKEYIREACSARDDS